MIKHIVMWKFKESAEGATAQENVKKAKALLEGLVEHLPEIKELEAGVDFNRSERAFDLVLYSTFASKEDLDAYQIHPEHKKVAQFIGSVVEMGKVVDYEV